MAALVDTAIDFFEPDLKDFEKINNAVKPFADGSMSCETTPVTLMLWKDLYKEKVAFFEDMFFISAYEEGHTTYLLPFARDMKRAIELLENHCQKKNTKPIFFAAQGERLDSFLKIFGDKYETVSSRDDFEYIYKAEELKNLSGKKYHSKRNHISAFTKSHNWKYETLSEDNLEEVIKTADLWRDEMTENGKNEDAGVLAENVAIKRVLPRFKELGIRGGVIRIEGEVAAFCFGSAINDKIFDVHVEKALPKYRTAYSVINREFIANELQDFLYVNREEDLGLEGLRKAKLSYKPEFLLEKYVIRAK